MKKSPLMRFLDLWVNYADNYYDLKGQLESIFNRPVDLLGEKGIRNPYLRKQIENEKHLIYG
jgi:predicted nucleotidyltransferase